MPCHSRDAAAAAARQMRGRAGLLVPAKGAWPRGMSCQSRPRRARVVGSSTASPRSVGAPVQALAGAQVEVAARVALAPAAAGAAPALYRRAVWRSRACFCARYTPLATRRPPTAQTQASSPGPPHSTRRACGGRYSTVDGVPCVTATDAVKPKVCRPAHAPHSPCSKCHIARTFAHAGGRRSTPSFESEAALSTADGRSRCWRALARPVPLGLRPRGRARPHAPIASRARFGVLNVQFWRLPAAGHTGGAGQWGGVPAADRRPPVALRSACTLMQ